MDRHRNIIASYFIFNPFTLWIISPIVIAQQQDNIANTQADRIIQQEQQRQQQREQQRDEQRQQPVSELEGITAQPPADQPIDSQQCIQVDTIVLSGVTLLSKSQQHNLTQPYLNRCITLNDINQLLAAITNAYFEQGYVTSRAYIPAQDMHNGELQLYIVEGQIEALDSETLSSNSINISFPTEPGKPLNLRDLEQGIAQLNRLSSKQVTMQLNPGQQPGFSRIQVQQQLLSGEWGIVTSLDNSGQDSTGEPQLGLSTSIDDPFGLADYASMHLQSDIESQDNTGTHSMALHYDIPHGYWNFDIDVSSFEYESQVQGVLQIFNTSGESENLSGRISYLWHRDQHNQLGNRLALRRKKNLNYLEDVLLDTSSRVLASSELELWYQRTLANGRWGITLSYNKGLDAFGAETDDNKADDAPRAEFTSFNLGAHYAKPFDAFNRTFNYNAQFHSQTSQDILYGSEHISIGSQYTVRGFKQAGLSGNKGAYLRQSISAYLPKGSNWLYKYVGVFQLGLALDWGRIENSNPIDEKYSSLSGWGLALRSYGGLVNVSLEYAKAMEKPDNLPVDDYDIYLSIQYVYRSSI